PQELGEVAQAIGQLRWRFPERRSRRSVAVRHNRGAVDIQRTMRTAIRSEGEALRLWKKSKGTRTRRIVLLIDISGSMEDYARQLIRFAHVAVTAQQRIEAFTIGTRLTRITRELSSRDPDAALRHAAANVADWSGGTRLGETLAEFNDRWGLRGMARGSTVVILSDGWDRGDPAELAEQMQRLQRVSHRLVWVNPLKHTPGYAPLARGMAAALPYVDDFREGHSLASLDSLAVVLQDQQEVR
ncbi:MAG: VWA domain-containing protein, partial [Acidimicrobiales bacterium]